VEGWTANGIRTRIFLEYVVNAIWNNGDGNLKFWLEEEGGEIKVMVCVEWL
jgi:hypothetical protein